MAHTLAGFAGRRRREGGVNSLQEHPAPEAAAVWVTRPCPALGVAPVRRTAKLIGTLLGIKGNGLLPPELVGRTQTQTLLCPLRIRSFWVCAKPRLARPPCGVSVDYGIAFLRLTAAMTITTHRRTVSTANTIQEASPRRNNCSVVIIPAPAPNDTQIRAKI